MEEVKASREPVEEQRGSITRKPGSSKLYVDFRYHGRRVVKSTGLPDTRENRDKANEFLTRIFKKIDENTFRFSDTFLNATAKEKALFARLEGWDYKPEPENVLIDVYIQNWKNKILENFKSETKKRDYKSIIDDWIIPYFSDKTFFQLTKVELKQFVATLRHRKGPKTGESLSRSRCNNIILPLKEIWSDACDEYHWNMRDPFHNLYKELPEAPPPEIEKDKRKVFRFDELMLVLDKMRPHYQLATEFMLRTGAIGSELAGLRKKDITYDQIFFRNSIVRGDEKEKLKTPFRTRKFPNCIELRKIIDAVKEKTEGEYLFRTSTGLKFAEGTYRKNGWTPALKRAGLEYCVPYSLRHTFAAWCLAIGMDINRVVKLMGHNSKKMVYEVYADYVEGIEEDAEKILTFFGLDFMDPRGSKKRQGAVVTFRAM